jgi:hypothetical protein
MIHRFGRRTMANPPFWKPTLAPASRRAYNPPMSEATKLEKLADLLAKAPDEVFIQPHNVPDPDAIAASAGMQYLLARKGVKTVIVYDRDIEKADSVRMLELFGIEMALASGVASLGAEDWALLVDGQKGGGNLTDLPTDEVACIDHHEYRGNQGYRFEHRDLRLGLRREFRQGLLCREAFQRYAYKRLRHR